MVGGHEICRGTHNLSLTCHTSEPFGVKEFPVHTGKGTGFQAGANQNRDGTLGAAVEDGEDLDIRAQELVDITGKTRVVIWLSEPMIPSSPRCKAQITSQFGQFGEIFDI